LLTGGSVLTKKYNIERKLREWFRGAGRVVVVGIGNPIRMDDFVGVKIVRDLRGNVDADRVMLIEAETIPENHTQQVTDFSPTHVLLVDAAVLGLEPGESRLVNPEQLMNFPAFSTHVLPLRIFCEYLHKATKSKIALLLIEPEQTDFREGLTPKLKTVAREIADTLLRLL
jgi:hydrogenase 3 maturation protease